ncbi:HIRAN domain-containing protein [Sandarakinorhabdus sp.]|uniref:HIRAN domain-containing protein n=1 Tax=Sandarakinorhabdus sp. TaxID=1916663 RepID=UPI003F71FA61
MDCEATLKPEPNNRHDRNAVAVVIRRSTVGYLDRSAAVRFQKQVNELGASGASVKCKAMIVGGWLRSDAKDDDPEGHYGVKLDLVWPLQLTYAAGGGRRSATQRGDRNLCGFSNRKP